MKIGIFGGSFNPIHLGHQNIVEYVLKSLALDKILVVPVGRPSHRKNDLVASKHRLAMCKLAFANNKQVEISNIETQKEETSYTYDSLLEIRKLYGEEHEYFEIVGEDSLAYFHTWKEHKKILELSTLVVLQRKNFELVSEDPKIILLDSPLFPISSTEIRTAFQEGKTDFPYLHPKVLDYILKHQLYTK